MREIELLAPARDLPTAVEAIRHGADAVYIGAPRFGARAAAGNAVADIAWLVRYAHAYKVKVYVTFNTILYDDELDDARRLAGELAEAGVDALIVQDMALITRDEGGITKGEGRRTTGEGRKLRLHASTQMDNRTAEKVAWLRDMGFEQAVLARELTLEEIAEIHRRVPEVRLEVFVHGAICVSYNGQCYASQHCFGRSANRGECAQFCRMPFDLIEEQGPKSKDREARGERVLLRQRHLLSLRDMNRSRDLEALLDAGVSSLKIEGRLKDVAYVKNVVAYYRQRLDELFRRRPDAYRRSSLGHETITFEPQLAKSFNRLFTDYFLHGRTPDMANIYTPKSMGERVTPQTVLHNGDGLCYINGESQLVGFRVNRVEADSIHLANGERRPLPLGLGSSPLYRNYDHDFDQLLAKPTATRKVGVRWLMKDVEGGFLLRLTREDGATAEHTFPYTHEVARSAQTEQIRRQLMRLGDTPYEATDVETDMVQDWFIPGSVLADWRRELTEALSTEAEALGTEADTAPPDGAREADSPATGREAESRTLPLARPSSLTYLANVANRAARRFYLDHGATQVDWAMEVDSKGAGPKPLLMTCRYCIRYELGRCTKETKENHPLLLRLSDGRRFRLHFDCRKCQMEVYAE